MGTTRYTTINGRIISQNKNGVYTRLLSDPLGNVIATMDASGVKSNDTTYWPYGEVRTGGVSAVTNLGFCGAWGYYTDASARLYVRARYYRPVLGRWQSVDPLWPGEGAYEYARSSPLRWLDPSGLRACSLPCDGCEKWFKTESEACASIKAIMGINEGDELDRQTITVCCNGKYHVCLGAVVKDHLHKLSKSDADKVRKCIYQHERFHGDGLKNGRTFCGAPNAKDEIVKSPCGIVSNNNAAKEECPAYWKHAQCMLDSFSGDPCRNNEVCWFMCKVCEGLKHYGCKAQDKNQLKLQQYCDSLEKHKRCKNGK